jgi:hypothetical protein
MKVYRIDYSDGNVSDWFVADSPQAAEEAFKKHQVETIGYELDDPEIKVNRVVELADDAPLTMHDDGGSPETRTCGEWAAAATPEGAFLGSSEW